MTSRLTLLVAIPAVVLAACSDASGPGRVQCEPGPYLTQLPVDQDRIEEVSIIGQFNPPGDIFPRGQTSLSLTGTGLLPLRAPGNVTVVSVRTTEWFNSAPTPDTMDYSLTFEIDACPQISGTLHHVPQLTPALTDLLSTASCETYSTGTENVRACTAFVNVPIAAGTVLGNAIAPFGFDFDFHDRRVTYDYVAGHRYPGAQWAICVQPLFVPPLRDFLLARVGRGGIRRTEEPVCGTMEIDIEGTAQGMWVVEGHDVEYGFATSHLFFALAPDELHSSDFVIVATGHPAFALAGGSAHFTFAANAGGRVNRSFAQLPADGSIHCYTPTPGVPGGIPSIFSLFVALGNDQRVTMEKLDHALNESPCAHDPESWAFTGEAVRLMR